MALLIIGIAQIFLLLIAILILLRGRRGADDLTGRLTDVRAFVERLEPFFRAELRAFRLEVAEQSQQFRKEANGDARSLREELLGTVKLFGEQINEAVGNSRREQGEAADQLRESVQTTLVALGGELRDGSKQLSLTIQERLGEVATTVNELTISNEQRLEAIRQNVAAQLVELKGQQIQSGEQLRESVQTNFSRLSTDLRETSRQLNEGIQQRLTDVGIKVGDLSTANERSQESLRKTVEDRLDKLNESNAQKLEEVRITVDEKLHSTLEKRLTDSFGLVTEQLGSVQRGLGEMKDLATGVGDLKRVLTNIRSRGGYGEVQLEMLLDQMLSPEQYIKNANIRQGTQETVEFAIKLPGQANGESVLLPVDAKFPQEAWERLEDAQVRGDLESVKQAGERLETAIRTAAKDISVKYIEPPVTTNFAVMFLPTEGLFAEVVRRAGLVDELQTKYRVTVAGPTTFAALLTSFQMGFRTLAIQKKGSEVWKILAATKSEFEKFGGLMDRVERNIGTVQNTLRDVGTRTRAINRKLKDVETNDLQIQDPGALLGLDEPQEVDDESLGKTEPNSSEAEEPHSSE
jgi:DNA recombination protein RmuC